MGHLITIAAALLWVGVASANPAMTVDLPGGAKMEFVWIEPGTFQMGMSQAQEDTLRFGPDDGPLPGASYETFPDERPLHAVTIGQGFYLAKYELTQGQWERAMGTRPWEGQRFVLADPLAAASWLSWTDAQALTDTLNRTEGQVVYRLPTEAEWEYACRAGTATPWHFPSYDPDDHALLSQYAWHLDSAERAGEVYAHPVGLKLPNLWGLYDMYGNVGEWCQDRYAADYYEQSPSSDPTGPSTGDRRVLRGGSFGANQLDARSAARAHNPSDFRPATGGVRLVRMASGPTSVAPQNWGRIKAEGR